MGRYLFRLPDVGEGIAEAEIIEWHVSIGDTIEEDQSLADVMTDKATVEIISPVEGRIIATHGTVGEMAPIGSVLVELEVEGAGNAESAEAKPLNRAAEPEPETLSDQSAPTTQPVYTEPSPSLVTEPVMAKPTQSISAWSTRDPGEVPLAAPATRHRAHELGIPLQYVPGTGPSGRITPEDLETFIASGGTITDGDVRYAARDGIAATKIIGLRRKIAEKMQQAKSRIPHIYYVEECDVTELETLRANLNANRTSNQPKLTLLPFLMRALVRALPDFPQINARYDDNVGVLHTYEGVHIGIATQTQAGLMVPVVRHAETYDIWGLATELGRAAEAARCGTATRNELAGSTITLTSMGPVAGIVTAPVINYPEVAILAPNKIAERPVVDGHYVTVRKMMNISSSFDHRIVDGYDAALFIQRMKRLIEHPALIFME